MLRSIVFLTTLACSMASGLTAQTGLLVVAHGANQPWNDGVRKVVEQVRWSGPVTTAFLMGPEAGTSGWAAGIAKLTEAGAKRIVIVPLMVSSAGAHFEQVRFYAGEIAELPKALAAHAEAGHGGHGGHATHHGASSVPMAVTPALDDAPELGLAIQSIWAELSSADRTRPLVFVAHGPTSDEEAAVWMTNLSRAVGPVAAEAGVPFAIELIRDDAPPPMRAAAVEKTRQTILGFAARARDSVTVLPLLISRGTINTVTIPKDLANLPISYHPAALAPSPHLARWIERIALARTETTP